MAQLFANAAQSVLTSSISDSAVTLQINPTDAGKFPVAAGVDWFKVALQDSTGNIEYVKVQRAIGQSVLTVMARSVEDSGNFPPRSFTAGSLVELRMTAADIASSIAHPSVNTNAHAASAISYTPVGELTSVDVQDAITELDTDKLDKTGHIDVNQVDNLPSRYATGELVVGFWPTAPVGTVALDGTTIGNATSGATNRANADTQALFAFLWTNFAGLVVQDSTGTTVARGASAAADFAANRRIAVPAFRDGDALLMAVTSAIAGNTLGAVIGHGHTLTMNPVGDHAHQIYIHTRDGPNTDYPSGNGGDASGFSAGNSNYTTSAGGHTPTGSVGPTGGTENLAAGMYVKGYLAL